MIRTHRASIYFNNSPRWFPIVMCTWFAIDIANTKFANQTIIIFLCDANSVPTRHSFSHAIATPMVCTHWTSIYLNYCPSRFPILMCAWIAIDIAYTTFPN